VILVAGFQRSMAIALSFRMNATRRSRDHASVDPLPQVIDLTTISN
jgi:multisubunit Na+/H+ antiporter MnhC subunit